MMYLLVKAVPKHKSIRQSEPMRFHGVVFLSTMVYTVRSFTVLQQYAWKYKPHSVVAQHPWAYNTKPSDENEAIV